MKERNYLAIMGIIIFLAGFLTGCGYERFLHQVENLEKEEVKKHATIIAHRGEDCLPDNSILGIKTAFDNPNCQGVEIDIRATKCGNVVVFHDGNTGIKWGADLNIADSNYSDLSKLLYRGEKIPLLSEVLELIPQGKKLFIEIKTGASEAVPVIEAFLKKYPLRNDRIVFISFSWPSNRIMQDAFQNKYPNITYIHMQNNPSDWHIKKATEFDGLGVQYTHITEDLINKCKKLNLPIYAYTVNNRIAFYELIRKVEGIITDRTYFEIKE